MTISCGKGEPLVQFSIMILGILEILRGLPLGLLAHILRFGG